MHVAIDARMAFSAGIGRCVRSLVPRLARAEPAWRFTLLGDRSRMERADWAALSNAAFVDCRAPVYGLREQWQLVTRTPSDADVFWAPHYNVPVLGRKPLVTTVHDVAHLRLPEFTRNPARRAYARTLFAVASARSAEILCDSEFSRSEFESLVGLRARRPIVVHNGIDEFWFDDAPTPRPVADRYFVFVGGSRPHKNLGGLVRALAMLTDLPGANLIVVGSLDSARTRDSTVAGLVESLDGRVRSVGDIQDELLRAYIRHAEALIMPSFYEGFGFPPLEAMAAGTPAIVSRAGSLPEVCGDAALYCDTSDPADMAQRMREIWQSPDLKRAMAVRGRTQARRYRWDESATALRDALVRATQPAAHA